MEIFMISQQVKLPLFLNIKNIKISGQQEHWDSI